MHRAQVLNAVKRYVMLEGIWIASHLESFQILDLAVERCKEFVSQFVISQDRKVLNFLHFAKNHCQLFVLQVGHSWQVQVGDVRTCCSECYDIVFDKGLRWVCKCKARQLQKLDPLEGFLPGKTAAVKLELDQRRLILPETIFDVSVRHEVPVNDWRQVWEDGN